ncbi:hypothetical protein BDR22DRAFT_883872 [Usnea florida]
MPSEYTEPGSDPTCPHEVQVLRIPANGSKPEIFTVDTVTDDKCHCENISARTLELEFLLGHIPDLKLFHRSGMTDLDFISLFDRDPSSPSPTGSDGYLETGGAYYIYKCITKTPAKLPANKHLRSIKKGRGYGDAFVLQVLSVDDFDCALKAVFGPMHDLLMSLNEGDDEILKELARW